MRQPVRRAANLAFCPSLPIASDSWKSGTTTRAARALGSTTVTDTTFAGDSALRANRTADAADLFLRAGRSALLVAALSGEAGALLAATEDRLHQPYRAAALPETAALIAKVRDAGLAGVLSGAGPSVLVLARDELEIDAAVALCPQHWRCAVLGIDVAGAAVTGPGMD